MDVRRLFSRCYAHISRDTLSKKTKIEPFRPREGLFKKEQKLFYIIQKVTTHVAYVLLLPTSRQLPLHEVFALSGALCELCGLSDLVLAQLIMAVVPNSRSLVDAPSSVLVPSSDARSP